MAALVKNIFLNTYFRFVYCGTKRRKGTNIARFHINKLYNTAQNCCFCLTK